MPNKEGRMMKAAPRSHFLPSDTYAELRISWYMPDDDAYRSYDPPPSGIYHLWAASFPYPFPDDGRSVQEHMAEIEALAPEKPEKYHFLLTVGGTIRQKRKYSPEAKAKIRRRNMEKRVWKKDPLFADQFIRKHLEERPDYFSPEGIARADRQQEKDLKQYEADKMERFISLSVSR